MLGEWELSIAPRALKRLKRIPDPDKRRMATAIYELRNGPHGDIKPLAGREDYRLRVGGWRILFLLDMEKMTVTITSIESRGDVYK